MNEADRRAALLRAWCGTAPVPRPGRRHWEHWLKQRERRACHAAAVRDRRQRADRPTSTSNASRSGGGSGRRCVACAARTPPASRSRSDSRRSESARGAQRGGDGTSSTTRALVAGVRRHRRVDRPRRLASSHGDACLAKDGCRDTPFPGGRGVHACRDARHDHGGARPPPANRSSRPRASGADRGAARSCDAIRDRGRGASVARRDRPIDPLRDPHTVSSRGAVVGFRVSPTCCLLRNGGRNLAGDVLARAERWRVRSLVEHAVLDAYETAQLNVHAEWAARDARTHRRRDVLVDLAYLEPARRPVIRSSPTSRLLRTWRHRWRYIRGYFDVNDPVRVAARTFRLGGPSEIRGFQAPSPGRAARSLAARFVTVCRTRA